MSCVFQNIDPPPPPESLASVVYLPPLVRGKGTLAGWRGGWGVNILEDEDTALFSTYVSTLWKYPTGPMSLVFCRLYPSALLPPRQCMASRSVISLLLTNTVSRVRACLSIHYWRGFVEAKRKTSVGLLVFNSFMAEGTATRKIHTCYFKLIHACQIDLILRSKQRNPQMQFSAGVSFLQFF